MNLPLLQLGDSALPIGGYSHSWGLEAAIERGLVRDPATLECWVRSWLRCALGPLEGVVVAAVCRAAAEGDAAALGQANELLDAGLTPATLRSASREMGEQLLALAESWPWAEALFSRARSAGKCTEIHLLAPRAPEALRPREEENRGPWHHAVVFATLAATAGATLRDAVQVYLHQAALGVISAGVRAIPIGHTHGQQVLARLHGDIEAIAGELEERELETAGSFCPAYEVLCHAQTQLYTRLFRS
jgi:urease accessory protein